MGPALMGIVLFCLLLLIQAVHILRSGEVTFFLVSSDIGGSHSFGARLRYALLYLVPGVLALVLAVSKMRKLVSPDFSWDIVPWMVVIVGLAAFAVACPDVIVGWVKRTYPQLESRDAKVIRTARWISLMVLVFTLLPILLFIR